MAIGTAMDSLRQPEKQVAATLYVAGIRYLYHPLARPLHRGRVRCRHVPSCSDYSIEAVERFGIRDGLALTYRRINSCRKTTPIGTTNPVHRVRREWRLVNDVLDKQQAPGPRHK